MNAEILSEVIESAKTIESILLKVAKIETSRHNAVSSLLVNFLQHFRKYMNEDIYQGTKGTLEGEDQIFEVTQLELERVRVLMELLASRIRIETGVPKG